MPEAPVCPSLVLCTPHSIYYCVIHATLAMDRAWVLVPFISQLGIKSLFPWVLGKRTPWDTGSKSIWEVQFLPSRLSLGLTPGTDQKGVNKTVIDGCLLVFASVYQTFSKTLNKILM